MRVHQLLLSIPALALLAASCGPSETETADTMAEPDEVDVAEAPPAPEPEPEPVVEPEPAPEPEEVDTAAAEPPAEPEAMSEEMEAAAASVDTRQASMKLASWNMGPIGGMLRGNVEFDAAVVETNTGRLAALADMMPAVFMADTTSYDGETEALDTIWSDMAGFEEKAADLAEAARAAEAAAASGDEAAARAAMGGVGQACGSCHDDYRAE